MRFWHQTVGVKWAVLVVGFWGVLVFAGCHSQERLRPKYLAGESRLVGGGLKIEWQAPETGTVYLVEEHTRKLVQTFTLESGETYKFSVETAVDADDIETLLGIDIDEAQFLLYFKPVEESRSAVRTDESSRG